MTAGASRAAPTITQQPALAPSPQPRPAPTARALPSGLVAQGGQNCTPIRGQICKPIDTDAFDLGGVQAVNLGAAPAAFLLPHSASEVEQPCELGLQPVIVCDLAVDVGDDAAKIGLELAQSL